MSVSDIADAMHNIPDKLLRIPDSIPAFFGKGLLPLFIMWKSAIIVLIFKRGSRDFPCSYLPISLVCVLYCIFEFCICIVLFLKNYWNIYSTIWSPPTSLASCLIIPLAHNYFVP